MMELAYSNYFLLPPALSVTGHICSGGIALIRSFRLSSLPLRSVSHFHNCNLAAGLFFFYSGLSFFLKHIRVMLRNSCEDNAGLLQQ